MAQENVWIVSKWSIECWNKVFVWNETFVWFFLKKKEPWFLQQALDTIIVIINIGIESTKRRSTQFYIKWFQQELLSQE